MTRADHLDPELTRVAEALDQDLHAEMRLLAHGAGRAEHAEPDEQELRHVDRPDQRVAEEAHDRRDEDEAGDAGEQHNADRKLDLAESLQHETLPMRGGHRVRARTHAR